MCPWAQRTCERCEFRKGVTLAERHRLPQGIGLATRVPTHRGCPSGQGSGSRMRIWVYLGMRRPDGTPSRLPRRCKQSRAAGNRRNA